MLPLEPAARTRGCMVSSSYDFAKSMFNAGSVSGPPCKSVEPAQPHGSVRSAGMPVPICFKCMVHRKMGGGPATTTRGRAALQSICCRFWGRFPYPPPSTPVREGPCHGVSPWLFHLVFHCRPFVREKSPHPLFRWKVVINTSLYAMQAI